MPRENALPARIGVLDSGVGGLSVLAEIHRQFPNLPTIYFADQGHLPYGPRPYAEIHRFVSGVAAFLMAYNAPIIVLACHTASATSLQQLRLDHPDRVFVGIEPAVKPAVQATRTGVVGVLTTQATADGQLYRRVLARFAGQTRVLTQVAPDLVTVVEAGTGDTAAGREAIHRYVDPLLAAGADQIVLACTHYPFLREQIRQVVGPAVGLVDPGPAVARQVGRVLPATVQPSTAENLYFTSGDPVQFQAHLRQLIGVRAGVRGVDWRDGQAWEASAAEVLDSSSDEP